MTTTFILAHGEEFIQCPYNTAHQITNARFLTHLDKCRKAYIKDLTVEGRKKYIKICRHNAMHHVPSPELRFYEERCVDAYSVVRHMAYHNSEEGNRRYDERRRQDSERERHDANRDHHSSSSHRRHSSSSSNAKPETKPVTANAWGLEEEDWDSECAGNTAGYDPEVKLKSEVVIYNPAGLTKSERKKFRNEVRQKAAEMSLKGEPVVDLPTASSFDVKPNITGLKIKDEPGTGNRSPREPGEIDDDDDDYNQDSSHSRSGQQNRHATENRHSRRNDYDDHRRPSSSSSSSQHYSGYSKSGYSRSSSSWLDRVKDDYYPDSDDYEGIDPYI